jgi:trigger factor
MRASTSAKADSDRHQKQHEEGIEHEHGEEKPARTAEQGGDENLPEVNDDFVKSFGPFENVEAFKTKIRENIKMEKELEQKDKRRLAIVEMLIEKTKGEIPEILIEAEVNKILYKLEADVTGMGLKFEDYLKQVGKTEEDLKKEWHADGEKRAKLQVIVHAISEKENLKPAEEEIKKEVENITKMYKDADPVRAQAYIEQMLTNEKVFAFLENQ